MATDAQLLDAICSLAAAGRQERWCDAACGPGLIARRLAKEVHSVRGFDLTPAMVELARREATAAGLPNIDFEVADATALPVADGTFDGAVARFALHHIPVPGRLIKELARVVRPGGKVVLADPLADTDAAAAAWSQEIERLRDPSHWASLSRERLNALLMQSGLELEEEHVLPLELDFDEWLVRGGADVADQDLVQRLLHDERPGQAICFQVSEAEGRRTLRLQMWLARLRR